jgi:hypothetical protein
MCLNSGLTHEKTSPKKMGDHKRLPTEFCCSLQFWVALVIGFALLSSVVVTAAVTPITNCYALDAENRLYDLTDLYGREFQKEVGGKTYNLRFCKDFQERSQDLVRLWKGFSTHWDAPADKLLCG